MRSESPNETGWMFLQTGCLAKVCHSTNLKWVDALPIVLMAMRNTEHAVTRLTPHEALTGRPMPGPMRQATKAPSLDECQDEGSEYLCALTQTARVLSTQVENAETAEQQETQTPVQPGDRVWVKVHKAKWGQPKWTGPYEVVLATSYSVKVKGKKGAAWHHVTHCAPDKTTGRTLNEMEKTMENPNRDSRRSRRCSPWQTGGIMGDWGT